LGNPGAQMALAGLLKCDRGDTIVQKFMA
jgi:hypothetical protein